jgi:aspergillopepsin I
LANKISNRLADQSGAWDITYSGYSIGNGPFQALSKRATMDTGTALIYLDDSLVSAYWAQVTGAAPDPTQEAYVFPCTMSSVLPSLTLSIGNYDAVLPGSYLNSFTLKNGSKWSTIFLSNDRIADLLN